MKVKTYSHIEGIFPEGLCVVGEDFVAKKAFGNNFFLVEPHDINNQKEFLERAARYVKVDGVWVNHFGIGNFPKRLDSDSEETRALDRISHLRFKERLMAAGSLIEDYIFYGILNKKY